MIFYFTIEGQRCNIYRLLFTGSWDLFKDSTYADACLSRMVHKAYRLECKGRDMRKPV